MKDDGATGRGATNPWRSVAVVGAGAWGTALALAALRAGRETVLIGRDAATIAAMAQARTSGRHLPGIALPADLALAANPEAARGADLVLLVVPAQAVRSAAAGLSDVVAPGTPVVLCAKGLERGSAKRLTEVLAEALPDAVPAVLSGPSFAIDVARGLPTAVTIAAADETLALALAQALSSPTFRPYGETDLVGVEIGGALKNVLAIAAGIVAGRRLGASAAAALTARGFAELRRLGERLGARPETLMGLSGLGDLVLTCSSGQSRNFAYGEALGRGGTAGTALAEGAATAPVARDLARRLGVAMPITEAVAAILEGEIGIDAAVDALMTRPIRREAD
ncbi:NAD(P)H-dependent glycerol-3-phosphate dehydrogenase [Prosthecomicrobium pneumaticum]|uniref:Glycerol-3-phosphate dehydrogenase [NAD(P)+] n=1 Tax=Prosthecomicrobium pneumaticum TaxID=81895 RepID=A0A7W9FN51_9HYPH|nr:NAD(P)H-dependent glycerol-3-phosphate dehydrogenase [Prosthecomicrobium pneumaticum]MBB5753769.1 glycerol-3-phosphate dehydrogenase (NAD(P)+) [Prosthecomicrobium pneumaticum]